MKTCVGAILSLFIKVVVFGCFFLKGIKLVGDEDRTLEQQIAVLSESELNQKLDFGNDKNFSVGVEFAPDIDNFELRSNKTKYEEIVNVITNLTSINV